MTTIAIADDHEVVRQGVRVLLKTEPDLRVVGEAADGIEALRIVERHKPDVLLLDVVMPGRSGIDIVRDVLRASASTRVIVLSMHVGEPDVASAFHNGAVGYVPKQAAAAEIIVAIRQVMAGHRYLGASLSQRAIEIYLQKLEDGDGDPFAQLTRRESEVLQLAASGCTNQEIAGKLFLSPRTVETHRANAMHKLGLKTHTELVLFAVRRGIISLDENA